MKNLLLVLIVVFSVFSVSCVTYSGNQSGTLKTVDGTVIKFKNAKIIQNPSELYIVDDTCQYYIKEKNVVELSFNKKK